MEKDSLLSLLTILRDFSRISLAFSATTDPIAEVLAPTILKESTTSKAVSLTKAFA